MINHPILLKELGVDQYWISKHQAQAMHIASEDAENNVAVAETVVMPEEQDVLISAPVIAVQTQAMQVELRQHTPATEHTGVTSDTSTLGWTELADKVANCDACHLCSERTNTVFGVGDQQANWMFVGEGPGRNEDLQGEPFVGKAGQLLDNMIKAMGVKRGQNVYIANIIKCRPTDQNGKDRRPSQEEVDACLPYLKRQIDLVQPKVIIALGHTAAWALLGIDPSYSVGKLRSQIHHYQKTPVIVTYHPSYLLRQPQDKGLAWKDLCLAMQTYAEHT